MTDAIHKWSWQNKAKEAVAVLSARKFDAHYAQNAEEAKQIVQTLLPLGASIAVGGSVTLNETGIMDMICNGSYRFIDRFHTASWDETLDRYREGLTADVFVSGTNAVTMDGELVNLECTGNRTAAIEFGPKKVVIVVGANKIVKDLAEGIKRAKEIAPLNAKRIGHGTPCTENGGHCVNCTGDSRVCNIISIIDGCYKFPGRISVIVVAEELGY